MSELLDSTLLARLRLEHGYSVRRLAQLAGTSAPVIRRLESGHAHERLRLGTLQAIADILGRQPAELLAPINEPLTTVDAASVIAVLAIAPARLSTDEIAAALETTTDEARELLSASRSQLVGTGLTVHRNSNGWKLLPATALDRALEQRLVHARHHRRGLTRSEAQLLLDAHRRTIDTRWEQNASSAQRVTLAQLLNAGYLTRAGIRYAPTATLDFDSFEAGE